MGIKQWNILPLDEALSEELSYRLGLDRLTTDILVARGYRSAEEIQAFLDPKEQLHDPFLMADMAAAAERVGRAIRDGERIAIYGDYDCDGITATVMLYHYLESAGADVLYYTPDRDSEGYGLNREAVKLLYDNKVQLVITVDNGISALEEADYAAELGLDLVITDHHMPRETLPKAVAVVNPHRADCPYPFKELSGVGVAFKLICALEQDIGCCEMLEVYSDLVCIGTVADVVPLTGENRVIVRHGLEKLPQSDHIGLQELIRVSGLEGRTFTSELVAFGLAPRINAVGRLESVDRAIDLLLSEDEAQARELAQQLDEINRRRRGLEEDVARQIGGQLKEDPLLPYQRALVLHGPGWHHGIVGIVASKVVERFGKPCFVLSEEGDEVRGSGRSVPGFSIIRAISDPGCARYLTRYGGHDQAAGLTLRREDLPAFIEAFLAYAGREYPEMPGLSLRVDAILSPEQLQVATIKRLGRLQPFGTGNETPLFALRGLTIEGLYPTNDQKHLRIRFARDGASFYGIYFNQPLGRFPLHEGDRVDLAANLEVSSYNGREQVSVQVRDVRPSRMDERAVLEGMQQYDRYIRGELTAQERRELLPSREDLAAVYRFLRRTGRYADGYELLPLRMAVPWQGICRLRIAADVLCEMGLVAKEEQSGATVLSVIPDAPRADLSQSRILAGLNR